MNALRLLVAATLLLPSLLLIPPADAQATGLSNFAISAQPYESLVEVDTTNIIKLDVHDLSGDPLSQNGAVGHSVSLRVNFLPNQETIGWSVQVVPPNLNLFGGDHHEVDVHVRPNIFVRQSKLDFQVEARFQSPDGDTTKFVNLTSITFGPRGFVAQAPPPVQMGPGDIEHTYVKVTNGGLLPRAFDIEINDNPCGLKVSTAANNLVAPKSTAEVPISVLGPEGKFWYPSDTCGLGITVSASDTPSQTSSTRMIIVVTGTFVDPAWFFTALWIAAAALLIFFFVARRKSRIEEEILGRPQKPWTIPIEKVYLEHLKERDPQAHYVVRHFLMEEEYASALLWYGEFKKATRGTRSKERLVIAQEHRVKRLRKKWTKRIAKPIKKADRLEARLQRKLDRQGRKGLRERQKKWKKLTKKMEAAHEKRSEKILAKWEKQVKRAEKKKQPVPEKPVIAEPDYPAKPSGDKVLLAEHKWNKKAVKAHTKANKVQGNLEVKFEKKEAKLLKKVRKRVLKIAKKLDDPEFEEQHPLLQAPA